MINVSVLGDSGKKLAEQNYDIDMEDGDFIALPINTTDEVGAKVMVSFFDVKQD